MLSLAIAGIAVVLMTVEGGAFKKLNGGALCSMVSEVSIFFQSILL